MTQIKHEQSYKLDHLKNEKRVSEHGSCTECKWWQKLDGEFDPEHENPRMRRRIEPDIGECRHGEPRLPGFASEGEKEHEGLWPITYKKDWCGKFEPHKGEGGLAGRMKL